MDAVSQRGGVDTEMMTAVRRRIEWLVTIAIVGILYYFAAVISLHFLRPDYDPVQHVMSNYAVGQYGVLMTLAFLALAASFLSLALSLYQALPISARSGMASILLAVAGLGMVAAAIFPTDVTPDDSPRTLVGAIHIFAGVLAFVSLVAAAFILAKRVGRDERWHSFRWPARVLAPASLGAFVIFFLVKAANLPYGGIAQRLFLGLILMWFLLAALHLRKLVRSPDW